MTSVDVTMTSEGVCCLSGRGISFAGVVFTFFYFFGRVFTSVGVAITYEGVVLPLWAWFYLCMRGCTSVSVDLPLWAWFYLCGRGISFAVVALFRYAWFLPV